jgi:hypothetical protein
MLLLATLLGATSPAEAAPHGIPPGHLPPPGTCRVWHPGVPPGHQPPPTSCAVAFRQAAPGTRVVERPARRVEVVHTYEIRHRHVRPRPVVYAPAPVLRVVLR